MLADIATPQAKAKALDQGADDFITTPCDPEELFARIRAIVRRSQGHANSVLRLGPVELSLDRREVRVHGQKLHLSRREFAVLELLFLKQGVILNKVAFLNHLYCGMEEPEMKTIDVIICRLRKKLAVAGVPNADRYGVGLRLHPARSEHCTGSRVDAAGVGHRANRRRCLNRRCLASHAGAGHEAIPRKRSSRFSLLSQAGHSSLLQVFHGKT